MVSATINSAFICIHFSICTGTIASVEDVTGQHKIPRHLLFFTIEVLILLVLMPIGMLKVLELELISTFSLAFDILEFVLAWERYTIQAITFPYICWFLSGEMILWAMANLQLMFANTLFKHCLQTSAGNISKTNGSMYRQLQLIKNIINEEMLTWQFLWFIFFSQLTFASSIFFSYDVIH